MNPYFLYLKGKNDTDFNLQIFREKHVMEVKHSVNMLSFYLKYKQMPLP